MNPAPSASATTLLHLMRLASPSLPVGGFSYSEGMESAVASGRVDSESSASRWLADQLHLGLGRSELPCVARALAGWQRDDPAGVAAVNAWFGATRESAEMRLQSEQMGRSLAHWLRNRDPVPAALATLDALSPAPSWPVAFALAAALAGATAREALLAYAAGWAENLTQAAMKSVPLGQLAGQRILDALAGEIAAVVDTALELPLDDTQAFTPMLAILSAQHEAQYSRLFRS